MENRFEPLITEKVYKNLPDIFQSITADFTEREKDIVLTSAIGAVSAVIPNIIGNYKGEMVYANLYVIIVAPPASGKGVMMKSRILVQKVHDFLKLPKFDFSSYVSDEPDKDDKKEKAKLLPEVLKIVPANISSAQLYITLANAENGIVIIESEADTLNNVMKQEWGLSSDILRKAFHHEAISISRKGDAQMLEVKNPKISMVLTGTPAQMNTLAVSKENGLFSRLLFYSFDDIADFQNPFDKSIKNVNEKFQIASDEILNMYKLLIERESDIEFKLTEEQENFFWRLFAINQDYIAHTPDYGFVSNLFRLGLMTFRIAMILTAIRNRKDLGSVSELTCSNQDFKNVIRLINIYKKHSLFNYQNVDNKGLTHNDEEFLDSLPTDFATLDALLIGEELEYKERTIFDKLSMWRRKKYIKKITKGVYSKLI